MDKLKELLQSWERAASGLSARLEVNRATTAKGTGIIGLVTLFILCSSSVAGQTQIQIFNATPLLKTEDNPMAPAGLANNNIDINLAWIFDSTRVPLNCEDGDTAKLLTPAGEGGSVIVDNFMRVNGVNVCNTGGGLQGPTGTFNCFSVGNSAGTLGQPIQTVGFSGVGMIDLPVGNGLIIPLGPSVVMVDLYDFGVVYGNTSIILETTCDLPGRMTGGGSVFDVVNRFTHGFTLHCSTEAGPNRLEVVWGSGPGRGRAGANRFHLTSLDSVLCTDDPALNEENPVAGFDTMDGTGTGRMNGVPGATIEFQLTDDGEPGVGDFARFSITPPGGGGPIVVDGMLNRGNHQAHP